jgi:dimethylargininase
MPLSDFTRALARAPAQSVVSGLRSDPRATPSFEGVLREHGLYVAALRALGVAVEVLSPLEAYPDSIFVEDPALVFPQGAILLRPGAVSRAGEADAIRSDLERRFDRVLALAVDEHADGGDVLVMPDRVLIGLSARTTKKGAAALEAKLAELGRRAQIVETPATVLHLKSAASLLDEDTVLATQAMVESAIFAGSKILIVPEGEEAAANALAVNGAILIGDRFAKTIDLLAREGFDLRPLPVTEIGKLDAGLSCMSLRWRENR